MNSQRITHHNQYPALGKALRDALEHGPIDLSWGEAKTTRSSAQNSKIHSMFTDLSRQVKWHGAEMSVLKWKRLATAAWLRAEGEQPQMIPALDGNGFDVIFERTSKLSVKQTASLIEWLLWFGADQTPQVQWSNPADKSFMDHYEGEGA